MKISEIVIFFILLATSVSANDIFSYEDIFKNTKVTKEECEAKQHAVWVEASWIEKGLFSDSTVNATACIRYFPSKSAEHSKTAILFFSGDITDKKIYEKSANYDTQVAYSTKNEEELGVAIIRVGRPSLYGSTGMTHKERRLPIEAYLNNAAISKIKEKFGYERISIAGQSGGGGIVSAILTLGRTDLDCAVSASGVSSIKTRIKTFNPKNYAKHEDMTGYSFSQIYDPIDYIKNINKDSKRTTFIIGDPRDTVVSFESQQEFFENLKSVETNAVLIEAEASSKGGYHWLSNAAIKTASMCVKGSSVNEIKAAIRKNNQLTTS